MKKTTAVAVLILVSLAFAGCASLTPGQRQIVSDLETQVLNIAVAAGSQYVSTGGINSKQLYVDSIGAASGSLTKLIATQNESPAAVQSAIIAKSTSSVVNQQIAPKIAEAVNAAINNGTPPAVAVADAAAGLAKAKARVAAQGP